MTGNTETIESIPLCGGDLILIRRTIALDCYGESSSLFGNIEVGFCIGSEHKKISNLQELASITLNLNCKLIDWLQGAETSFAKIIAPLIDVGRVVSSIELFSFIENKYGVSVSQNLPRIEGKYLRFLCGKFQFADEPTIADISIDLESLEFDIQYLVSPTSDLQTNDPMND